MTPKITITSGKGGVGLLKRKICCVLIVLTMILSWFGVFASAVSAAAPSVTPVMSASPGQPLGSLLGRLVSASPDPAPAIAAGQSHSLGLRSDGTLWAWGYNYYGQLGLGDITDRNSPTQVGTSTNWSAIAGGWEHSLGLRSDGTLWAWGRNQHGQLGLGDNTPRYIPTQVGTSTSWTAIAGGWEHSLGLRSDGTLWAWGRNQHGQLGLGDITDRNSPTQVGTSTNWSAIAGGDTHSLGLKSDGTLWAWGHNVYGRLGLGDTTDRYSPTQVGTATSWSAIAAGYVHSLGLRSDGTLWAWGLNYFGHLGVGDTTNRTSPTQVGTSTNWSAIAAGGDHSLGLKSDGTLWAWGKNDNGQLGLGDTTTRTSPTQVGTSTNWSAIAAGRDHSLGLRSDGTLWAWGYNNRGQLGLGDTTDRWSPTQVPLNLIVTQPVTINSVTDGTNTITTLDGTQYLQDANSTVSMTLGITPTAAPTLYYDDDSTPLDGSTTTATGSGTSWSTTISASDANVYDGATIRFCIDVDGTKYYRTGTTPWSYIVDGAAPTNVGCSTPANNAMGVLTSTALVALTATDVGSGLHFTPYYFQLSTNTSFTAGLQYSGWQSGTSWSPSLSAGTTYYWRVKAKDNVGNESSYCSHTANQAGYGKFTTAGPAIAAGWSYSLALRSDGTLWSWGSNYIGELGLGDTTDRYCPTQVGTSTDWTHITAGFSHSLCLKSDGTLWAWGSNDYGQLGLGDITDRYSPTQVGTSTDWTHITAGACHSLALRSDGTLWSWGWNHYGELGLGDNIQRNTPTQVGTATNWTAIATGTHHSLALQSDGTLWAWGLNNAGGLGLGDTTDRWSPTQVGTSTNWTAIAGGSHHSLGLRSDGTLWSWGWNISGQLGFGDTTARYSPTQVGISTNWTAISAGGHSLALKSDGTLWSWGYNGYGELGLGDTADRYSPTQVGTATNWTAISAGEYHSLGLRSDGTLWSWGRNYIGELGLGDTTQRNSPTQVWFGVVPNTPPTASFTYSPTSPTTDNTIQFTDTSTDTDGTISSWSWNFGDGTPTSTLKNPTHKYSSAGTYTATLTVTDNGGATSSTFKNISVTSPPQPGQTQTTLSISPTSFTLQSGNSTTLTATLKDENNNPLAGKTITWGKTAGTLSTTSGSTDSLGQVLVTFTAPTVTAQTSVTVTASFAGDNQYQASSGTSSGTIAAAELPSTTLSISPSSFTLSPSGSKTLTATLTSDGSPVAGKTVTWDMSAGSVSATSGTTDSSGQVSVTYTAPSYETTVTVTASFAGDTQYVASSGTSSGTIAKASTTVTVTPSTFTLQPGSSTPMTAMLKTNGTPLAGKTLSWSATSGGVVPSSGTTGSLGQVSVTYAAPSSEDNVVVTVSFAGDSQYQASSGSSSGKIESALPIQADVEIKPDTLQIGSVGEWVTCYIELPDDSVENIDVSSIRLEGTIQVDPAAPTEIGDYDNDDIPDLMVKFNRASVENIVLPGPVTLTVTGNVGDSTFIGSDKIDVIRPGHGALASARSKALGETPDVREEVYDPDLEVTAEAGDNRVTVSVSSEVSPGTTIVVNVDNTVVPLSSLEELEVLFNNEEIELADDYEDVLDTTDEDDPEYLVLVGAEGIQVLVSMPHFSVHTVTIRNVVVAPQGEQPEEVVTPPAEGFPLAALLAVLGVAATILIAAALIGLRHARGEATSELIERGLYDMKLREVEMFREIRSRKEFTIPDIMRETGVSTLVAWRTVQKLIKKGLVKPTGKVKPAEAGRGKPSRVYEYVGD